MKEIRKYWDKPFRSRVPVKGYSSLEIHGGSDLGVGDPPLVEPAVAYHLHPNRRATLSSAGPSLPGKLERFTASMYQKVYKSASQTIQNLNRGWARDGPGSSRGASTVLFSPLSVRQERGLQFIRLPQEGDSAPGGRIFHQHPPAACALGLARERMNLHAVGLPLRVINTIQSARATSTRTLHDLKWRVFEKWCEEKHVVSFQCSVAEVLCFLQEMLDKGMAFSTIKEESRLNALCPVQALRVYVDRTKGFRKSNQLFVSWASTHRDAALQAGNSLHTFTQGGVTRLKDLMHLEKGCWKPAVELAETLAVWSVRMCEQFLWRVKGCLPPSVLELIEETLAGGYRTVLDFECPTFWVGLSVQPKQGWVIRGNPPLPARFHEAEKKLLYNWSAVLI
ncbi:hypothetical protein SKAU_G00316780 [Synaphobranchus kaupii]|uniref:Uncharacterized protein n=1 Tax=Synaphobranchus kaupii TaxID=118154 RepID=A0A9Q1IJP1_SYNKA|nr:hypothetical protein SKAU_G00316780 [Synaphobranchus kaupii]